MALLTSLPSELVVHILIFLSPTEIQQCRQICRFIFNVIKESSLQYLIELDSQGYAAPLNPRTDLNYDEKIQFLRELRSTTRTIGSKEPTRIELATNGAHVSNSQFSRGIYARGGPSLDLIRSLDVHQLASRNKNTPYEHWRHSDLGVHAHDFRIDADMDLLVLLERDPVPGDPETDLQLKFHLRSLRTGLKHPLAAMPTLVSNEKFTSTFSRAGFQIFGKLLAILCYTNPLLDPSSPRLTIWNWTTGGVVTFAEVPGRNFTFVSPTTFAVPYDRRKWKEFDIIGSLEIYTFDPNAIASRARQVASLHLPATTQSPCHSSSTFTFTPYAPVSSPTVPARIFEPAPEAHTLCFRIRAFNIQNHPGQMATGTLFIPSAAILDAISPIPGMASRVHINWEDWARGTSWISKRSVIAEEDYIFGRRAAMLAYNVAMGRWEVLVHDLGSARRDEAGARKDNSSQQESDRYLDDVFTNCSAGARSPSVVTSFLLPAEYTEGTSDNDQVIIMDDEHVISQSGTAHGPDVLLVYSF